MLRKVRKLQCIGGPHDGEWREVSWLDTAIILVKARTADALNPSAAEIAASSFPSVENMHRAAAEQIQKTTYVVCGSSGNEHLEVA